MKNKIKLLYSLFEEQDFLLEKYIKDLDEKEIELIDAIYSSWFNKKAETNEDFIFVEGLNSEDIRIHLMDKKTNQ